jgi:hypothetical protein
LTLGCRKGVIIAELSVTIRGRKMSIALPAASSELRGMKQKYYFVSAHIRVDGAQNWMRIEQ